MIGKIKEKKKLIGIIALVLIILLAIIIFIKNRNSVGVYYRTYTNEKNWTSWSKNSETNGTKINPIANIEIKIKNDKDGRIVYSLYRDNKWSNEYHVGSKIKNKEFSGIKIGLTDKNRRKYDICYRTYNDDNKWLEWTCSGGISGNKDKNISAIEVVIVPKNAIKYDYIKEYNQSDYDSSIGF